MSNQNIFRLAIVVALVTLTTLATLVFKNYVGEFQLTATTFIASQFLLILPLALSTCVIGIKLTSRKDNN